MTCGFLQTYSSAPNLSFITKINNWPSAFYAELAAVALSLLVSTPSSSITIYTDFKSHSSNTFNNTIDTLIKQHHNLSKIISFSSQFLSLHPIIPKWNNIIIDTHLQNF
ncbi:hypothetical protein C1645_820513 [Glomus cerebriforme]|uniref:RNase H type-1 domain-containing protein n=1 Tax=Glomus cerebriforme TaxID=658196 RepID=A0A397T435_9GLOM|nr:hypothetical protein C1645_820513 [Glomus cerebriforme]